ncbi:Hypothetical protein CINCED_3A007938, partial [Cinara cedri]
MINMMSTAVSLVESMLFTANLTLLVLCWLCEKNTNIAVGVWNTIVLIRDAWHLIVKDVYTTFKDEDPVDEEPELVVSSSDQSGDQISCSITADLVSRSFPLCHFPFPQGGENTAQELEEVMRNMQVVDLTIKRVQPLENSINYLQFVYLDLNLGKGLLSIFNEMFEFVDFLFLDQLDFLHYRIDDSELEIVAVFNGETIVLEMR